MKELVLALLVTTGLVAGGDVAPVEVAEVVEPTGFYVGVGGSVFSEDREVLDLGCAASGVVIAGYEADKYLDVEVRGGSNLKGNYETYEAYLKPKYEVSPEVTVYGLVGGSRTDLYDVSLDSYSVGAGLSMKMAFLDVTYNEELDMYNTTAGLVYRF